MQICRVQRFNSLKVASSRFKFYDIINKMTNAKRFTSEEICKLIADDRLNLFYNSRSWRRLAHDVMRSQNNECQLCRARGRYSPARIVHHVKHLRERPDLAYSRYYDDEQGMRHRQLLALCFACHEREHGRVFKGNIGIHKGYTNEEKF